MTPSSWAVAIPPGDVPLERELSGALCRCLGELGYRAALVRDGETAGLHADVLLLLFFLGNFPEYVRRLRQIGLNRPQVLLWQMDPLPPVGLSSEAEAVGLRAAGWRERLRLNRSTGPMPRWEKLLTLVRLREWAYKQLSAPGYRNATRMIGGIPGVEQKIDWRQVRAAMENWWMIRAGRREGWLDATAVSTLQRQRFLAGRSVEAKFIPVGACEEMGRDLGLERDIDVLFLGRIKHGPRAESLAWLVEALAARGLCLHRVTKAIDGEERTRLLNRTRVLINLHNYPWTPAWIRFLMAARCGAAVVSEPTEDQLPFAGGVHYAPATVPEMPAIIQALLRDDMRRGALVTESARLCNDSLTMLTCARSLAEMVSQAPRP